MENQANINNSKLTFEQFKVEVLNDYRIAMESREASLLGRKEVLTGKAKFGIFGDGKEVPQLAMAKQFKNGDFRSGYYRDQTFMFATQNLTIQQWFAGLFGHTDQDQEPMSAGRQMGGHFATQSIDADGTWRDLMAQKNTSSDISPTAGQMPRLLGLAQASKYYRNQEGLNETHAKFTNGGNEVAFGTIGDASTSEGLFWETMNAASVLQVPMVMSVWDDGHGISVPKKYQTTKESISEALAGFQRNENHINGIEIFKTKAWDYPHLCETYAKAVDIARTQHVPVLVHVEEVTQPQGHSTSGSHERYKDAERLQWELDFDCVKKMREWLLSSAIATEEEITIIETSAKQYIKESKKAAWTAFLQPVLDERTQALTLLANVASQSNNKIEIEQLIAELGAIKEPIRKDTLMAIRNVLRSTRNEKLESKEALITWLGNNNVANYDRYNSKLHSDLLTAPQHIAEVAPEYTEDSKLVDAREILRDNFDALLTKHKDVLIFGEDVGDIGDVNQGCEGLQAKHGLMRVTDTGIREATIVGQGIGMALRGLRPIAEIQYLDYLLYAVQILSDDLATLSYRTKGKQKAPLIIRTRGHRLEGVWHSGSPMGMIINALRGIHVCVPRNMTKAAGFYNTLLASDEPAIVIECLNGYRLKEKMPANLTEFKTPLGVVETTRTGADVTLVTYGSTWKLVTEAATTLANMGIEAEIIDIQTLLPFDLNHQIVESIKKTNRLVVIDEDVEGGASAYILQQILQVQNAYQYLDSSPLTLHSKNHRPAYGTDGDYFSKPSTDDIIDTVYNLMRESNPSKFASIN
ncbi:MAG: transketolase [Bacteroidia bacterium]|nr:transketolase [Bacteroidia bacterium]